MGVLKVYIEDVKEEFVNEYIFFILKVGVIYEGKYLFGILMVRFLIVKKFVNIVKKENVDVIVYGVIGKGND